MVRLVKRESPTVVTSTDHPKAVDVFGPIDRAFEQVFGTWFVPFPMSHNLGLANDWLDDLMIPVDELRRDGSLVIRAELPGIDPDKDVKLTVADGMLNIEAHRRAETKLEDEKFVRQEMRYGSFERSLRLPEGVMESDITASYKDGILEVVVPEGKQPEVKSIAISKS